MAEAAVVKRMYVGGFAQPVTTDELRKRFAPFGSVEDVSIPATANGVGTRGFGYVSLEITPTQLQRCIKVYTGAKWKGGELRIEEAKEDFRARLSREQTEATEPAVKPASRQSRCIDTAEYAGVHAEDMSMVTATAIERFEGWSRNKYGRPVLKHTLMRSNGKALVCDPAKNKHTVDRVFASVSSKPSSDLLWEYNPDHAQLEFAAARKLSAETIAQKQAIEKRLARKRQIDGDAERAQKRLMLQGHVAVAKEREESEDSDDGGFESDSGSEILDLDTAEILAQQNFIEVTPFENADEVARLVAQAAARNPELQAKLESGAFDSSSEDEDDVPSNVARVGSSHTTLSMHALATTGSAMDYALARERKRVAAIASQFVKNSGSDVESAGVLDFEDGGHGAGPQDGTGAAKKSNSAKSNSDSSSDSSSDSGSDSSSDSSSGSSSGGGKDNNNDNNGSDNSDDSSDSDSSSDSDDSDDSSDSDDSDDEKETDAAGSDAMDIDDPPAKELKSLFGASSKEPSGGLFSGPTTENFKFTQLLGLEEDEPSEAMLMESEDHTGPVTGGSRIVGPAERNLNVNRLPMFFPDVDSPMFKRPETAAFQRQATEDELEAGLEASRKEQTREYKALQRSAVRKSRKLYESKPKAQ